jgi:adenine-specific DNA-methyltransferase
VAKRAPVDKTVTTLTHDEAKRKNIPTAEYESVVDQETKALLSIAIERRNRDLDPQSVWRGKDEQDASDLVVQAPPLYIQEKVHPKALIDDLLRDTRERAYESGESPPDLFVDFNGVPKGVDRTEFYHHDQNWSNRMILGDSLQVMASLSEREGLREKVQCIYFGPPYGIEFNSNFQWSTTSRNVKDGIVDHITREPEQVKAFRDTWRDGIHSYLAYLRDRLVLCRELLNASGSCFVQISDDNLHWVRGLMDEVFSSENFVAIIAFAKTSSATERFLAGTTDYIVWYAKAIATLKYRPLYRSKRFDPTGAYNRIELDDGARRTMTASEKTDPESLPAGSRIYRLDNLTIQSIGREKSRWKTNEAGMEKLKLANRLGVLPRGSIMCDIWMTLQHIPLRILGPIR